MLFDWSAIPGSLPILWQGMIVTLQITLGGVLVGVLLGTLLALFRLSPNRLLSWLSAAYVTVFRSIPLVMVLFWFHLVLVPLVVGLLFPGKRFALRFIAALTALALGGAFEAAEIIRA